MTVVVGKLAPTPVGSVTAQGLTVHDCHARPPCCSHCNRCTVLTLRVCLNDHFQGWYSFHLVVEVHSGLPEGTANTLMQCQGGLKDLVA